MNETVTNIRDGWDLAVASVVSFVPKFLMFLAILLIGYYVAKIIARVVDSILERVGFDNLVERGGIRTALERSGFDASDVLAKLAFYTLFLFVLQLAFGVFGQNPISELLTKVISFLPNIFVAIVIVVIAGAIAAAVREITRVALGGLGYGRFLANAAFIGIWAIGGFAALNQLGIAPAIVNGLFYAMLAVFVGSAIVAIGGGGITPMRAQWERAMSRIEAEAPRIKAEAQGAGERVRARSEDWKREASEATTQAQTDTQRPVTTR